MVSFRESSVDEPAAHALIAEYFDMRADTFPMDLGSYHAAFPIPKNFTPPEGVFLVVVEDGEDVGCGGIKRIAPPAADVLEDPAAPKEPKAVEVPNSLHEPSSLAEPAPNWYEVKHLWIQPRMQGRRLGRALLEELERRAIGFGATDVVLDTNASLNAAGNLYRSSGYLNIEPYNDNPNATDWFRKRTR